MARLLVATIAAGTVQAARPQQPLGLDSSFRTVIESRYVTSVLPLPDGDVIVSGLMKFPGEVSFRSGVRLNPDGSRDLSFANVAYMGGKLTPWNGRIYQGNGAGVRRSWPDGSLDADFDMVNSPYFGALQGGDYHVYPDGRILMSGVHDLHDTIRGYTGLHCLIWFSNTGYLDTTQHHRKCAGSLSNFRELPDGRFIGSGATSTWDGQPASNIIRFQADGELDTTFQANVFWGRAESFLPLSDGRVYAVGRFRITGMADTLRLVRFMPDGSLDPTFNNHLEFGITEMTTVTDAILQGIHPLDEGRLVITGNFETVAGAHRRDICLVDTTGNLIDDYFDGPGCGNYLYAGFWGSALGGIAPAPDGSYFIYGGYYGYDDGATNDTLQRMVSRLYALDVGINEQGVQAGGLTIWPNPGENELNVATTGRSDGATVQILDVTGRVMCEDPWPSIGSSIALHTSHLAAGPYLVRLLDRQGVVATAKWMKR